MRRSLYGRLRSRFGTPISPVTRREFLKGSIAAGTALLLSGPHLLMQRARPTGKSIILAGLAGLTAAYELKAAGYDVTLLEARDRVLGSIGADAGPVLDDTPWDSPNAKTLDLMTIPDKVMSVDAPEIAKKAIIGDFVSETGVPSDRQSYLALLAAVKGGSMEKYWTETEVYHCKDGNQQLAQKLAAEIGAERILLNMPACAVTIGSDRVVVTCADGRTFGGDDVILTVPPSVWDNISFDPPLPPLLRPQMEHNVKYLISLKNRSWLNDNLSPESLSNGNVQATWELTAGQEGDGLAGMLAYSGGPSADAMRAIPADQRDPAYAQELKQRYPKLAEAFVASRFMDWPAVPRTRASYSFAGPGEVTTMGPILHKGIGGRLHFAGEHSCYKFAGYMEGALTSGVAVTRRLDTRDGVTIDGSK